jgi:hypothetical protein
VVQDVNNRAVQLSSVGRAVHRRDVICLAIVAALGLTSSDVGQRLAYAAKKKKTKKSDGKRKNRKDGKKKQDASGSGRDVVRVAQKYKGSKYVWGEPHQRGSTAPDSPGTSTREPPARTSPAALRSNGSSGVLSVVANGKPAISSSLKIRSSAACPTSASLSRGTVLFTPKMSRQASSSQPWTLSTTANTMRERAVSFELS